MIRRVGILVFEQVEVLDFCGPFEVFATTRLDVNRAEPPPYEVLLIAERREIVAASGGLKVMPDHTLEDCPPLDVLIVPGGWGTRREIGNKRLVAWIAETARGVETLASVCTGSLLLGAAGLLDGRRATTHWNALGLLESMFPDVTVVQDEHVVEDGDVLTSAGISAGIDLSLRVVARHHGEAIGRATARHMEYPYPIDNARRV
jgi:transcriptional regulator GlxA family with amidase domain